MAALAPKNKKDERNPSSVDFDALIDLLASDGIDDRPLARPPAPSSLRNQDGRLDYSLIRSFFSGKHPAEDSGLERTPKSAPLDKPSTPPEQSCNTVGVASAHTAAGSANPDAQGFVEPKATEADSSNEGQNAEAVSNTFEIPITRTEQSKRNMEHEQDTAERDRLPIRQLTAVIEQANDEIAGLRRRIDELKVAVDAKAPTTAAGGLAAKQGRLRPPTPFNTVKDLPASRLTKPEEGSLLPKTTPAVDPVVASMTEQEAKEALSRLLSALSLSPSALSCSPDVTVSNAPPATSSAVGHQQSVESIQRSLEFVEFVDELIWRRSYDQRLAELTDGFRDSLPRVFSEDNVMALKARLSLWERAVRKT